MRIAMLCSNHAVSDARVTHKHAASLSRMGHCVRVFGMASRIPVDVPGVDVQAVVPFRIGGRARVCNTLRLLGPALQWKPDVVTCHEPETAALGLWLKARLGVRVVFDVHELWHETMAARAPGCVRDPARWVFAKALQTIARRCDWVTVVSPWNLHFYRKVRHDRRVDIIHNSPRVKDFPPCRHDVDGPIVVAHEGNLDQGRGMAQILEALAIARRKVPVRLLIVGAVRPQARDAYHRIVERLSLADAIDLPGWIPYGEVGEVLSSAQIGIIAMQPTRNNFLSLSNKLYNYMCCGQAVVAMEGSATADLVRQANCGLAVDSTEPRAIADALVRLARDADSRSRLGENGRRAIIQTYGWHRMEERLSEIYAALAR